jgi:hypothetical protein
MQIIENTRRSALIGYIIGGLITWGMVGVSLYASPDKMLWTFAIWVFGTAFGVMCAR